MMPHDADFLPYLRRRKILGDPLAGLSTLPEEELPQGAPTRSFPEFEKYREMLSKEPQIAEHKPSRFRSIMAGIAGGAVGATQGAREGIMAGDAVRTAPFRSKLSAYQQQLAHRKTAADLERELAEVEAMGVKRAAEAEELKSRTEANRQRTEYYRNRPIEWKARSLQEALQFEAGKRGPGPIPRPTVSLDAERGLVVTRDPEGKVSVEAYAPARVRPTPTDPAKLEELRHKHRMAEIRERERQRRDGKPAPQEPGVSVASQAAARKLAIQHLLESPEYSDVFLDKSGNLVQKGSGIFSSNKSLSGDKLAQFIADRDKLISEILDKSKKKKFSLVDEDDDYEIKVGREEEDE